MWIRALGAIGIVFALALVSIPAWVLWNSRDLDAIGDEDLRPAAGELADADNAFVHLEAAAAKLTSCEGCGPKLAAALRGGRADRDALAPMLETEAAALAALERVFAAPGFRIPIPATLDEELPEMLRWQRLAYLLCLRGLLEPPGSREGLEDVFRALDLGHRIEGAHGAGLVAVVVAVSIRNRAVDSVASWLAESPVTREEALALARRLEAYRPAAEAWARVWGVEYEMMRRAVLPELERSRRGEIEGSDAAPAAWAWLPLGYYFHPKRTMQGFAERYRVEAANGARLCAHLLPHPGEEPSPLEIMLSPNGAGRVILSVGAIDTSRYQHKRCASESRLAAVQAMAALRAWQVEHGTLPERLDALVPGYLAALPRDGFDGEPLRYDRERAWLWSVGSDGEDSGGRAGDSEVRDLKEPTFPIRVAARG